LNSVLLDILCPDPSYADSSHINLCPFARRNAIDLKSVALHQFSDDFTVGVCPNIKVVHRRRGCAGCFPVASSVGKILSLAVVTPPIAVNLAVADSIPLFCHTSTVCLHVIQPAGGCVSLICADRVARNGNYPANMSAIPEDHQCAQFRGTVP